MLQGDELSCYWVGTGVGFKRSLSGLITGKGSTEEEEEEEKTQFNYNRFLLLRE